MKLLTSLTQFVKSFGLIGYSNSTPQVLAAGWSLTMTLATSSTIKVASLPAL